MNPPDPNDVAHHPRHAAGTVLAERYRLGACLAHGAFGACYQAQDLHLGGRPVTLRTCPPSTVDDDACALLARVQHSALPQLSDRFERDGTAYLVFALEVERTLDGARKAQGGRIPARLVVGWLAGACDALAYLRRHAPRMHCGVSTESLAVGPGGRVVLLGVGMRPTRAATGEAPSDPLQSPEALLCATRDERADVYALGAIGYTLLTGASPPAARSRLAGEPLVDLRAVVPDVPVALEAAIVRALDLDVIRRQQSVLALRDDLLGTEVDHAPSASTHLAPAPTVDPPEPPAPAAPARALSRHSPRVSRSPMWGALLALALGAGLGGAAGWVALDGVSLVNGAPAHREMPPPHASDREQPKPGPAPLQTAAPQARPIAPIRPPPLRPSGGANVPPAVEPRTPAAARPSQAEEEREVAAQRGAEQQQAAEAQRQAQQKREAEAQRQAEERRRAEEKRRVDAQREAERLAALQRQEEKRRQQAHVEFGELTRQAEAAAHQGRWAEALAAYDRALALEAGDAKTWNNRGNMHSKLQHWDAAARDYGRALELTRAPGEKSRAYGNRGFVYRRLGRTDDAMADYTRALELDRTNRLALYNRGYLYLELSKSTRFGERQRFCALAMADLQAACGLGDEDGCRAVRTGLNASCRLGLVR